MHMAQNLWFFFKTSTISSIFITTFWLSLVKDLTNCPLNSLIVSFWEHTFWCNFWKMDAFFQLGGLFLSSSASPKIFLWKLTSNSFHQKQIWEVLSIKGIISDGLELLILILVPFSSSKHILYFYPLYVFLLFALYSNLNPVPVLLLPDWKWKKRWLLVDVWLGGKESPQYGFPNMGDVFESPS